jgi:hypothetical protein
MFHVFSQWEVEPEHNPSPGLDCQPPETEAIGENNHHISDQVSKHIGFKKLVRFAIKTNNFFTYKMKWLFGM